MPARNWRDEAGTTLAESLVVLVLFSVVGALITNAFIGTSQAVRHTEDEAQGLADVRKVVERLGRDIRDARSIDAGASENKLVLWVDYNADYKRATAGAEDVTWELQGPAADGHYEVVRTRGTGGMTEATTLVDDIAFQYDALPLSTTLTTAQAAAVRLVTVSMRYDAVIGSAAGERTVTFSTRLRNVS